MINLDEKKRPLLKLANYDRRQHLKSVTPLIAPYQHKSSRSNKFQNVREAISKKASDAYGLEGAYGLDSG